MHTKETVEVELDETMNSRHRFFVAPCDALYRKAPILPRLRHGKKFRMNRRNRLHGDFMLNGEHVDVRFFCGCFFGIVQHSDFEEFQKLTHELHDDLFLAIEQETSNNQCLRHSLQ